MMKRPAARTPSLMYEEEIKGLPCVLDEHASREGKNFVKFGEKKEVQKAFLENEKAGRHKDLLLALRAITSNLGFTEKQTSMCLEKFFSRFHKRWNVHGAHRPDWVVMMTRRLRNVCFVVSKACRRPQVPKWLETTSSAEDDDVGNNVEEEIAPQKDGEYTF